MITEKPLPKMNAGPRPAYWVVVLDSFLSSGFKSACVDYGDRLLNSAQKSLAQCVRNHLEYTGVGVAVRGDELYLYRKEPLSRNDQCIHYANADPCTDCGTDDSCYTDSPDTKER